MIKEEMDVMTTEAGESITGCGKLKILTPPIRE